ncbi:MAG: asparagine--tRNA ligase [Calditrichaeota bacterium]|nr:asparagine--tRNA ligase [Calditrichota bacterium]
MITPISRVGAHVGTTVTLGGWLYNSRSSGKLHFLQVRDGTGLMQCVVSKADVPEADFDLAGRLTQESSVYVTGIVREDKRAPGGYELTVQSLQAIQIAVDYPITPKEHGPDFLLDRRHLWIRSRKQHAVLSVRHQIIRAIRNYFDERGFVCFDAPMFTPNAVEGTTTLFPVEYFGSKVYLTQSGQLYGEAGAMAFGKVYVFGPVFRAEKSKTRKHLTEFWMIEPEVAFLDLDQDMDLIEDFLVEVVGRVLEASQEDLKILERDTAPLERVQKPFPRVTYTEAARLLDGKTAFKYGDDFGAPDEEALVANFDRPVLVHRWPAEVKAFYMKRDESDPTLAKGVDCIAPEGYGEIVGGGERETSLEELERRIAEHQLPKQFFEWYLDLRRYGTVPHAGFGLGLERTVSWICGLKHVRESIPFPRMMYRMEP